MMIGASLVRSKDELHEFYIWLLSRAKEEEYSGNNDYARVYQELAEVVKKEMSW